MSHDERTCINCTDKPSGDPSDDPRRPSTGTFAAPPVAGPETGTVPRTSDDRSETTDEKIARVSARPRPPLTHVAVRHKGVIWSLPAPYRHHHIFSIMNYLGVEGPFDGDMKYDQGFLDDSGRYLNRRQALPSAYANDQIKNDGKLLGSVLTSEDLW